MKKLLFLALLFSVFLFRAPIAHATQSLPPGLTAFLGQDHRYSVTFRGNGEAVVSAQIIVANNGETPLKTITLRVPRVEARDVIAFQIIRQRSCLSYQPAELREKLITPVCLEYSEPDYFQTWYDSALYQKAETSLRGDTISVTLPQTVKPNASASFILYYRAFGYAKKNLIGAYDLTFETLKVEDRIQSLLVGVTTDSDLVLKGVKGKVDYRFDEGMMTLKSAGASAPTANVLVDRFVSQIGQGEITKKASDLQPLDSYVVKGGYADSRVKLYAKEVIVGIVITLAVIFILFLAGKKVSRHIKPNRARTFGAALGASFLSAFLIVSYTLALIAGQSLIPSLTLYGTGFFLVVLVALVSLGIYGLLLAVPAVLFGLKRGVFWGLTVFGMTVLWLIIDGIIVFFVILLAGNRVYPPYPYTMMKGATQTPSSIDAVEITPTSGN